jgi:hypothetical protein
MEHAIQLRLSAHIAISLMLNGRVSIDSWAISTAAESLDSSRSVRNYNFLVETYLDYLTFPRAS